MCSDERRSFHASDENLQRHDRDTAVGVSGYGLMEDYVRERSANKRWPRCLARDMICFSCTSAAAEKEDELVVEITEVEEEVHATADDVENDETTTTTMPSQWWSWKRKLSKLFKQKPVEYNY